MDLNSTVTLIPTIILNSNNVTSYSNLEEEYERFLQKYRNNHFVELIAYLTLFGIGSSSNLYVFHQLMRPENRNNRMNSLLRHLTFADLMVIFVAMVMEILQRLIVVWYFGDFLCKFMNTFKIFTLYASSNIIVCIALDRFFAFVRPLSIVTAEERNKQFLAVSYLLSFLQSLPQLFVFKIEEHRKYTGVYRCAASKLDDWMESTYAIASVSFLYILPLIIIVFCYIRIIQSVTSSALIEVSDTRDEIEDGDELGKRKKKKKRGRRWRFGGEREVSRNTRMKSPNRVSIKLAPIINESQRKLNDEEKEKRRSIEREEGNSKANCVEERKYTKMVPVVSRKDGEEWNGREEISQEDLEERKESENEGERNGKESGRESMTCLKGNEGDSDGRKPRPVLSTSRTTNDDVVVIVNQGIEGKQKKMKEEVKEKEGKGKKEDEEKLHSTDLIPYRKATSSSPSLELRSSEAKTNCFNPSSSTFLPSSSDDQENHQPSRNILDRSINVVGSRIPEYSIGNQYQNPNPGESTSTATTFFLNHHRIPPFLTAQRFFDRIKRRIIGIRKEQSLTDEEERTEDDERGMVEDDERGVAEDDERGMVEDDERVAEDGGSKGNGRRLNEKIQSNTGSNYMKSGLRTGCQSSCNSIKRRYSSQVAQGGHQKGTTARAAIMDRARKRTLKMTIAIVATFILCWTPYAVMVIWYQIHMSSALSMTPSWLMSLLWVFAYTNSVLDPFVHSNHLFRIRSFTTLLSGRRNTGGNNMNGSLSNEITIESHL